MKKLSTILFILLVSVCFVITGCGTPSLQMPTGFDSVNSNGGFIVNVGDHLYFANAYKSYSSLQSKEDNYGEGVAQHNINRVQIEDKDDYTQIKKDQEGVVAYENVCNKIAGYETSNMFVVGEYLYFTTPNVHKNDSKEDDQYGKYQLELTTLFRIKLDGTGLKELYTTKTATALIYLAKLDGKQNVLIFDDSKLLRINVSNNSVAVQNLVDEGVVSVVFPNKAEAELTNIYFTKNRAEGDTFTGNKLARYNFSTNAQEDVSGYSNNGETTTLVSYDGNVLFYTRTGKGQDALYSNDFSAGAGSEVLHKYHIEGISTTSYVTIIDGNGEYDINAFVYEYGDNIYLQDMGAHADNPDDRIVSEKADIVFVDGTYVYYTTENGIFRISALTKQTEQITDTQGFEAGKVDFDGEYVYYFAKPENVKSETKYLYRAVVENGGEIKAECIAEILADDISEEKPETEEE